MLVAKDHKKLLLNLNEPDRVLGIIPGAKSVNIKGHEIVSVPYDDDTVRVLRNLGMKAPGPILHYYNWPGRFEPFVHQRETSEFATLHPRSFILNDMGTGKTVSVLWAFDYLRKLGLVDWMLVLSPLSTLERTWADEVFRNFPDMSYGVVYGDAQRRLRIAKDPYDVYIINHDGIKNPELLKFFCRKEGNGLIVVDELATFRNTGTDRWKAANTLINGNSKQGLAPRQWAWGLTGTPIPNEPTDAWGQVRLIQPGRVPKYFNAFRDQVMRQITAYKWVAKPDALDQVFRVMQPAIRWARDECIDLPPTTYLDRKVEMGGEQLRMYKQMVREFKAEYDGGQITAANEAVKLGKLLQIVCGVAYDVQGNEIEVPATSRIQETLDVIEQSPAKKVIVFVPVIGALKQLAEAVRKAGWGVNVVYGEVPKKQRDDIFHDFQQPNGAHVLIAQPGTMSHGLTLVAADTICWYAPTNSAETYQQANARIVRPGQKNNTFIVRIQGSDLERRMYERLEKRESTQGALLGMFE